jgi:hypothetical protein
VLLAVAGRKALRAWMAALIARAEYKPSCFSALSNQYTPDYISPPGETLKEANKFSEDILIPPA